MSISVTLTLWELGVFCPGRVMVMGRQSRHRWWMILAAIAGSMGATAHAVACEATGSARATVASGIIGGFAGALTDDAQAPDKGRLAAADQMTVPAVLQARSSPHAGPCVCRSRPLAAPTWTTDHAIQESRPVLAATGVPVSSDSLVRVARTEHRSTLHAPKRHRAVCKIVPLYDPNDDGTSNDTDDDDDTSKTPNFDDNTDVSIIACVPDKVSYLITLRCAPVTWIAPSSSSFLTTQRLRC